MVLSTSVKCSFWALLVTLATRVMAEEIVYTEAGIAVKADETGDLFSRARRAKFSGKGDFSDADKAEILQRHNTLRSQLKVANMLQMEWNSDLEKLAQNISNSCVYKHSSAQTRSNVGGFKNVGENIYAGTGSFEPVGIVQSWYDEVKDYDYDTNTCKLHATCGHYTQLVWADTKNVGCAVKFCEHLTGKVNWQNGYFVTCNYGPRGNKRGQKPYNA